MTTLAEYVSAPDGDQFVGDCDAAAGELLARLVGTRATEIPDDVMEQARLSIGANLYKKRAGLDTMPNYADPTGLTSAPRRPALDPTTQARVTLRQWLGVGLA